MLEEAASVLIAWGVVPVGVAEAVAVVVVESVLAASFVKTAARLRSSARGGHLPVAAINSCRWVHIRMDLALARKWSVNGWYMD